MKTSELEMEPPMSRMTKAKKTVKKTRVTEEIITKVIVQQVIPPTVQKCNNCEKMEGIGPVAEWLKQDEKFIPFNMKNYQNRLL